MQVWDTLASPNKDIQPSTVSPEGTFTSSRRSCDINVLVGQRDGVGEHAIGIEGAVEDPEPGGVATVSPRHLFAVTRQQELGVAARQCKRGEALPENLC